MEHDDITESDQRLATARGKVESGNQLEDRGDLDQALACYREAVALAPNYAPAHVNLGNALREAGRIDEAIAAQSTALELDPDLAAAHVNLGNLYASKGELPTAESHLRAARRLAPAMADAAVALAHVHEIGGHFSDAERELRSALAIDPHHAGAAHNLGLLLERQGRWDEAEDAFVLAITANPTNALALGALASHYVQSGRLRKAEEFYRRALAADPDAPDRHSALLFALNFRDDLDPATIFEEHQQFGRRFESGAPVHTHPPPALRHGRRIRVGYLSGDLVQHAVALFLKPVLEHHDRTAFEVYCYTTRNDEDELTLKLKARSDHWRNIAALDDAAAAAAVRDDGIDVLVDLSGHTAYSRILVFTQRAAPLQVTWLGYLNTTGLRCADHHVCDRYTDPVGTSEHLYTERLLRLPHSQWCYVPVYDLPVAPLPHAEEPTRVVFGSFNQFPKISDACLDLWCEVLRRLPRAELVVLGVPAGNTARTFLERLETRGIARDRVTLHPRLDLGRYFVAVGSVDIALDTFPYNGGTTTLDTLWMGVPLVALVGVRSIARGSFSILSSLGMPELIAATDTEYVEHNLRLAADLGWRRALRSTLRQRMEASPLMDAARFVRDLESGYRQMLHAVGAA